MDPAADGRARPTAHANPSSDEAFVALVRRELPGCLNPADLERRLRAWYPKVTVTPAVIEGHDRRWYVYRDGGSWVAS